MPMPPRVTSAVEGGFPFASKTVCWFEQTPAGPVQLSSFAEKRDAIVRARRRRKRSLFAVWPGQWRSDLFVIDNLAEAAAAVGLRDLVGSRG